MKRIILVVLLLLATAIFAAVPSKAQNSFYSDRALSPQSVIGIPQPVAAPIPYGSVRVCSLPLTQQQPCLPLATITDINGVTLSNAIGSNFGQLTTDVTGKFLFGCVNGVNYQVQIQQSASNTPALNYPITCPGGLGAGGLGANLAFTGNNTHSGTETFNGNTTIKGGQFLNDGNGSWLLNGPQNLDVAINGFGTADTHVQNNANSTTSTTSVSPGTSTITVGSTSSFTTNFGIALVVGDPYDSSTNETIATGSWSIVDGTHFSATFAKSHTQPYTVSQQGTILLSSDLVVQTNRNNNSGAVFYQKIIGKPNGAGFEWGNITLGVRHFSDCIPGTTCDWVPRLYGRQNTGIVLYGSDTANGSGAGTSGTIFFCDNDTDHPTPSVTNCPSYVDPKNSIFISNFWRDSQCSGTACAQTGDFQVRSGWSLHWRNNAGLADVPLAKDASDRLTFNSQIVSDGSHANTLTIGSGTGTTAGTAVAAGTSQSISITVTGATTTDVAGCSTNTAYPASWLTGITVLPPAISASNTVTLTIVNPTAASITPVAQTFRCTVVR